MVSAFKYSSKRLFDSLGLGLNFSARFVNDLFCYSDFDSLYKGASFSVDNSS